MTRRDEHGAALVRDQGRRHEAREVLAPVYGWFTEGFDPLDLPAFPTPLQLLRHASAARGAPDRRPCVRDLRSDFMSITAIAVLTAIFVPFGLIGAAVIGAREKTLSGVRPSEPTYPV